MLATERRAEARGQLGDVGDGGHAPSVPRAAARYAAPVERIWAPWRLEFVEAAAGHEPLECVFCAAPASGDDERALIVRRGRACYAILNLYPYANGHLMIAPYRHVAQPGDLDAAERTELWSLFDEALRTLDAVVAPHAANAGLNLGRAAGQGIEGHLHLHVVPRWSGDTSFMPVLADTKVIPQALSGTCRLLREAWVGSGA